jgi:excisionase family DNA binding protein
MLNQLPAKDSTTPPKYRLPEDKAAQIRTAPPVNMSVLEGAAYLCISPRKLRELIASRRVKYARFGAKIILRREYLDELVKVA